jgi:dTMP kinase
MLVTFEGMDGSGKTTLARVVVDRIARDGGPVEHVEKKDVSLGSAFVQQHMSALKSVLWEHAPDEPLQELGDRHWLHLQASWFAVLDHCRIRPANDRGALVVLDNWYYKIMARFLLKRHFDPQEVEQSFAYLTEPDIVFLLDVPAGTALRRKAHLSSAECGLLDGFSGRGGESFMSYQELVRQQMLIMGAERRWIRLDANQSPDALAEKCVRLIHEQNSGPSRAPAALAGQLRPRAEM